MVTAGCILGANPNENSTRFGAPPAGGTGGSTGADAGPGVDAGNGIVGSPVALFDSTTEGFLLDNFHDTGQRNLNDVMNPADPPPTLAFDGTQGSPSAGSLTLMAPYSGANQYVDIQKTFGLTNLQNWTGKTVYVRIKVTSGSFKGGVQFYVKSGSAYFFAGTYTNLAANSTWQVFKLNVNAPMMIGPGDPAATYEPSRIISVGLQLNSSGAGAGSTPVTFNIDSFSIDPPVAGMDAGMDIAAETGTAIDSGIDTAPAADGDSGDAAGN